MRDELLRRGEVVERIVTLEDLADATRLWLVNSVREEIEVRLEALGP
jgi:branched-subunit amino acid aminotransferase/4-amino-4-deoxychorismate lyase